MPSEYDVKDKHKEVFEVNSLVTLATGISVCIIWLFNHLFRIFRKKDESIWEVFGFKYDPTQDIFYSTQDAWQRKYGYCKFYDEAAPPLGMIIDCEPIYFDYDGKSWLIEFWKGQYGMLTGAEVGIYASPLKKRSIIDFLKLNLFSSKDDENSLNILLTLTKNGQTIFTREGNHWWLTGFKLGEFSEPSELVSLIRITMLDEEMVDAFILGLRVAGYKKDEFYTRGNDVYVYYSNPKTPQPVARNAQKMVRLSQQRNKYCCDEFTKATSEIKDTQEKLNYIKNTQSKIYSDLTNMLENGVESSKHYKDRQV